MVTKKPVVDGAILDGSVTEIENEYKGSEQKKTVVDANGTKYLLKVPDPAREKAIKTIEPYVHNAESEYLGCKIAALFGLPVQEVTSGFMNLEDREGLCPVCLCKDLRGKNERLIDLEHVRLSFIGDDELLEKERVSFSSVEKIVENSVSMTAKQREDFLDFYAEVFVLDALIGNTDRHNENIGFITTESGEYVRPALFDCGSSMLFLVPDALLSTHEFERAAVDISSVLVSEETGKRIKYHEFLENCGNPRITSALMHMAPKINPKDIEDLVNGAPILSNARKEAVKKFFEIRISKVIVPALKVVSISAPPADLSAEECLSFYNKEILPLLNKTPSGTLHELGMRAVPLNKRYLMVIDKEEHFVSLLPARSNNDAVREAAGIISFIKEEAQKEADKTNSTMPLSSEDVSRDS